MLPPVLLLVAVSALGPIVMNGVMPATTVIMQDLQANYGVAQMVLSVYLFAIMVSQIILGNLSDRFGRKPVMHYAMLFFAISSALCALAPTIELLLVARFLQGIGASVSMFLPRTIVRDVYARDKAASVMGYMTTAMMIAPLFGPAAGGWVTDNLSWRAMYWILCGAGLLAALFTRLHLNETAPVESSSSASRRLLPSARELFGIADFRALLLIQCGSVGIYYSFLAGSPYIMMTLRGYSASGYGMWFAMVAIGYLVGNLFAGWFSNRLGVYRMITLGMIPGAAGVLLFWVFHEWQHPLGLFIPMQLVAFSNGAMLPNVMSATMSVNTRLAGSASGIAGTSQNAMGIVLTLSLGYLLDATAIPLFVMCTLSALVVAVGYWYLRVLPSS